MSSFQYINISTVQRFSKEWCQFFKISISQLLRGCPGSGVNISISQYLNYSEDFQGAMSIFQYDNISIVVQGGLSIFHHLNFSEVFEGEMSSQHGLFLPSLSLFQVCWHSPYVGLDSEVERSVTCTYLCSTSQGSLYINVQQSKAFAGL